MSKRSRERRLRRAPPPPPPERAAKSPAPLPPPWSTFWREHAPAAAALFVLSLVVRVSVLLQVSRTPYFQVRNIDSEAYHQWAVRIAAGHVLPAEAFYQSPLYAYYLATLYTLFGEGTWSPRVIQVAVGSVGAVLVYAIGTRL